MTFLLWQHVCDQFSAMQNSSYTLVFDVSGHDLIFLQNIIANKKKWEHNLKKTNGTTFHPACGIVYHYTA